MQKVPTRIAIGTQKAGSTYLYNLLKSHPDVALSERTEVDFYSTHFDQGLEWYRSTFPEAGVPIDISPKYFMTGDTVAPRIQTTLGEDNPRLLLILRNPIEYINSHFRMQWQQGFFHDNPKYPDATEDLAAFITTYPHYATRGLYHKILTEFWLPHLPLRNFKIVFFEELVRPDHTDRIMKEILDFWGLPHHTLSAPSASKNRALRSPLLHRAKNIVIAHPRFKDYLKKQTWFNHFYQHVLTVRSQNSLSQKDRDVLTQLLRNDVHRLEELLGTQASWWKDFK